ncbi:MAG: twin-arginine translocase subunit TatC [Phycisphaerae bacterium]|jgi:sec-independent protein translocase protein TatC
MEDIAETAEEEENPGRKKMTLGEHLEEFRKRVIYSLIGLAATMSVTLIWGQWILAQLELPYKKVMLECHLDPRLTVLSSTAGFAVYFKVTLIAGALLASPWIFYQLWMFVSAGLYPKERRYVTYAVPFSVTLFVGGAMFFLYVAAPPMLRFLIGFSQWLDLNPMITLDDQIDFMTKSMFLFGLAFQTPLVILILAKIGLINSRMLSKHRRHVIVIILIVAGLLTASPNVVDQFVLAVPLYLLYELGVLLVRILVDRPRQAQEQAEARGEE